MSGETLYEAPRRCNVTKMRVHDYLYDSAFLVSGARDYARTAFKAAMNSAQMAIQPVYKTMFSELRQCPRMQVVYHPNCRLPQHMDRSYAGYLRRVDDTRNLPTPQPAGKDRFKYCAVPKKLLSINCASPDFHPPTPQYPPPPTKPRSRGTQSQYRESSAQTLPWQPDSKQAPGCDDTPEVLYLDKLQWGPGNPYRTGDLPSDFHTTEIINKMRHARKWMELVERGKFPGWVKKRDAIIADLETRDWLFREAEIDELQDIRLSLLHRMQEEQREMKTSRYSGKLAKLWHEKKIEMERKIEHVRHSRDRELRKLRALHGRGGRAGLVRDMRAARGGGRATSACRPDVHATLARHGYQAANRHARIVYDPTLLALEDHEKVASPPAWLEQCGQDLTRSCSGHHLPRDPNQLCERETKWSERFLETLHEDLKKARLGAAASSAGPLRVLKPRPVPTPRPATPQVEAVDDEEETSYQAAVVLQKVIRGRAVQNLMYEGRTRAAELTEELKTSHGLQREDRARLARLETKARDYHAVTAETDQKEQSMAALVDEVCGSAVSAALHFLEKELRRLKEERRNHAFILIALRDKTMREAAEAGRRQKEERRRREHDEMFKQILGVTQETVDAYLSEIVCQGVELAAEEDAVRRAKTNADNVDRSLREHGSMSTAEQHETVAELVHQFLLPEAHKAASRQRLSALQGARAEAARRLIFDTLDDAEIKRVSCIRCGNALDGGECRLCPIEQEPTETVARDDPRWKLARRHTPEVKSLEERYPPSHEIRCMLNTLVDEVVIKSRSHRDEIAALSREYGRGLRENLELTVDVRETMDELIARSTGEEPTTRSKYHYVMRKVVTDALGRSEPYPVPPYPTQLPSEIRREMEEAGAVDPTCKCEDVSRVQFTLESMGAKERSRLLPSEIRELIDMSRCKCDTPASPTVTGSPPTEAVPGTESPASEEDEETQ